MKKGIHPNYVETEIRCSCGNVIIQGPQEITLLLSHAPNVILSSQNNRGLLIREDVSEDSKNVRKV